MTRLRYPRTPGAFLRRLASEARLRRQVHHLQSLDDHLLRDIGVDRSGIPRAVRGLD
ncbi:MAG: DUF1127 domain-containing protein [Amaricoccus sp.]